jgi:cytochrome c-type biogenesis protein CcmH/NrfG
MAEKPSKVIEKIIKNSPYPGLRPFQREDDELFFGRDRCVNELLDLLHTTTFLTIIGEAYSGKTSLIKCGLENWILKNNASIPDTQWHIASFRPANDPYQQLTHALLEPEALGQRFIEHFESKAHSEKFLNHNLTNGSLSLHTILNHRPMIRGHKLLLVCDQFEDIFHLWEKNKPLAEDFVNLLIDSSHSHPLKKATNKDIFILISLRASYLNSVPIFPKLEEIIKKNLYLPPRLTESQLTEIIIKPMSVAKKRLADARKKAKEITVLRKKTPAEIAIEQVYKDAVKDAEIYYKLEANKKKKPAVKKKETKKKETISDIDPKLILLILKEIKNQKNQLPLLQHVLKRMWELDFTKGEHHFTETLYQKKEIRGFNEALAAHLEETYYLLAGKQIKVVEILFRQLTLIKKTDQPQRLHFPTKLALVADLSGTSIQEVIDVVEIFRTPERCFLAPAFPIKLTTKMSVNITHDVIVMVWKRIKEWQKKEADSKKNYQRLNSGAKNYSQGKADLINRPEINKLWAWSHKEPFNKRWAEYYGHKEKDDFKKMKLYLDKSQNHNRHYKYLLYSIGLFIGGLLFLGSYLFYNYQLDKFDKIEALKMIKDGSIDAQNSKVLEEIFTTLKNRSPNNPYAWMYLGIALSHQNKLSDAEGSLRKAHQLSPNNSEILLTLSNILMAEKKHEDARKFLKEARDNASSSNEEGILTSLADTLVTEEEGIQKSLTQQQEDWEEAVDLYEDALDISPKNDSIINKLGQAFALLKRHNEAIEKLQEAIKYNPNNPKHRRVYGLMLMANNQFPAAIKEFQLAVNLEEDNDENLKNLGIAYFKNNQLKLASQALQSAIKLNKENDQNHFNLGAVFMKQNKLESALISYVNARTLNPSKMNILANARILTKLKRFNEANNLNEIAAGL